MKKILLGLSVIGTVALPVMSVISCGSTNNRSLQKDVDYVLENF